MIGSLYSGISGLSSNTTAMAVIGDNIANVNTVAFKTNAPVFANVMSQVLGSASNFNIGRGVTLNSITETWSQGALENTGNGTDMAVNGRGFFIAKDANGLPYYTRAGSFTFDSNGYLTDPNGLIVQGYAVESNGNLGPLTDIKITSATFPPSATSEFSTTMNLDANASDGRAVVTMDCTNANSDVTFTANAMGLGGNSINVTYVDPGVAGPLSVAVTGNDIVVTLAHDGTNVTSTATDIMNLINSDPASSALVTATVEGDGSGVVEAQAVTNLANGGSPSTFSTTLTAYDSLGSPVYLTIDFTRTATGWDWAASASNGSCSATGTLSFDNNGNLQTPITDPVIDITDLSNGAVDMHLTWTFVGNDTISGYASPSITSFQSQNGYPPGALQGVSVDEKGYITGVYQNGEVASLYRIALADFQSYEGLDMAGDNLYTEARSSGQASAGSPGTGRLGTISPQSLEMSNVDLAKEFVKMMTTQRAFQANSRVISTSDEILNELINLKR